MTAKATFVEKVVAPQIDVATTLIPPHFYVQDEQGLELNLALASLTAQLAKTQQKRVRPTPLLSTSFLRDQALVAQVAQAYLSAGFLEIDLRLSPSGGEDEGPRKVKKVLEALREFKKHGVRISLGHQPTIGQAALAMGLIEHFSTGIGLRERLDFQRAISQQRRPLPTGRGRVAPSAGVFVVQIGATVPLRWARKLYDDTAIRSSLVCRLGSCNQQIDGPVVDPRGHYLHSRHHLVSQIQAMPAKWRPTQEQTRLRLAIEMRERLNKNHIPTYGEAATGNLKFRTIAALSAEIERFIDKAA